MKNVMTVLCLALTLAACSKTLSGTYVGTSDAAKFAGLSLEFSGNKVIGNFGGQKREFSYTIDGNNIKLQGGEIFTLEKDGSITSPLGPLKKK